MKKIFLFILIGIIGMISVKGADKYDTFYYDTQIPNMYITRIKGSNTRNGAPFMLHKSDGTLVYCIEPFNPVVDGTYDGYIGYNSIFGLTKDQINRINLIAKFGYGYGNHKELKWYGLTQYLIWETILDEVYFTDVYHGSKITAYTSELNEIRNLVNQYLVMPSMNDETYETIVGDEIIIEDTNNVLSNYKLWVRDPEVEASVSENKIKIKANSPGLFRIYLIKQDNSSHTYELYYNSNAQDLIYTGNVSEISASFLFKASNGKIKIKKHDSETDLSRYNNSFEGAVYGLYTRNGNKLVDRIVLDKDGVGTLDRLRVDDYYIQELEAPTGYQLNNQKYYFSLDYQNNYQEIEVYDDIITKEISINKYYGNPITNKYFLEPGAEFNLYDSNDNLIKMVKTDSTGYIKLVLPYGSYTLKQIKSKEGYELIDDLSISVMDDVKESYDLYNYEIIKYGNIHINKKGSDGKLLNDVEYELYAAEDIFSKDGTIYHKKDELITKLVTVEGKIEFNNLYYGKYYLKEIKTDDRYILDTNKYYFNIDKDDTYLNLVNQKIVDVSDNKSDIQYVQVPNTGVKDIDYFETFGILLILCGYCLGLYIYRMGIY